MAASIFRFGQERWVRALIEDGLMRLRSTEYYAYLEVVLNDRDRGDRLEGNSRFTVKGEVDVGALGVDKWNRSNPSFSVWGNVQPGQLIIRNTTHLRREPYGHVFCTARGTLDDLSRKFVDWGDAAVEITDPQGFLDAVVEEGVLYRHGNRRLSGVLSNGRADNVTYGAKEADFSEGRSPQSGPFLKPYDYVDQSEFRFYWPASGLEVADELEIKIPNPKRFFGKLIPLQRSSSPIIPGPALGDPACDLRAEVRRVSDNFSNAANRHDPDLNRRALGLLWRARLEEGIRLPETGAYLGFGSASAIRNLPAHWDGYLSHGEVVQQVFGHFDAVSS